MESESPIIPRESQKKLLGTFDEQYDNKERIPALDGFVNTIDIRPEKLKDEVPILFVPGWSETLRTYKKGFGEIVKHGRRVIGIEHPRRGVIGEHITNEGERKAEAVYSVMQEKGEDEYDIVGHSEGAVNALMAAARTPEHVRNVVLVNPAGLIGKDKFYGLALRFGKMILQDQVRSVKSWGESDKRGDFAKGQMRTGAETLKYILRNPKRALLHEVSYLVQNDVTEIVKSLTDNGVGVTIIANHDDPVFPEGRMRETVKDHDLFQFYTLSGGHNMINSRPDIFMPQVTSALERMRLVSEVGKDMVDVIGDEIIMKDPPPTSDNSEEVKRIREELGIRKVE